MKKRKEVRSVESLIVVKGTDQGTQFEISGKIVTIGRGAENSVKLQDLEVSRKHAEIRTTPLGRVIVDLNSSNGVFVNSVRTTEQVLTGGEQIQIGRTLLLYSPGRSHSADEENPAVDFSPRGLSPEGSQIIHSYKQETGKDLFPFESNRSIETEWFKKTRSHLNLIYHTTLAVSQTLDIDRLLNKIMDMIFEWAEIDRGCILLYNSEENALVPKVSRRRHNVSNRTLSISQSILDYVLTRKEGVLTSDASKTIPPDSIAQLGVQEAICVPMLGRYGLVGIIYIDITTQGGSSDPPSSSNEISPLSSLGIKAVPTNGGKGKNPQNSNGNVPLSEENDPLRPVGTEAVFGAGSRENGVSSAEGSNEKIGNELGEPRGNPDVAKNEIDLGESQNATGKMTPDHLKLMFAIGHQAALAVEDTQYYQAMIQSERLAAVGQTVAILSHHIKNILQGIRGGSFLIEKGLSAHDEMMVGKGWNIVEKNQTRISDLILDMLTFSKKRVPIFERGNIIRVFDDVNELMQGRAEDVGVTLAAYPFENIPPFYFDSDQIHRALTNLVTNAIDAVRNYYRRDDWEEELTGINASASGDKGDVNPEKTDQTAAVTTPRVELRSLFDSDNKIVSLIVDDNGPGVSPELRDELFKPFFSKNKSGGTGLGLAVTYKIIQEHKGDVLVDQSPLGGARFTIRLPFRESPPDGDDE